MEILVYRKGSPRVEEGFTRDDLPELLADRSNLVWVDLQGETEAHIAETRDVLETIFKFHHLSIEDCLETRNQPKVEAFDGYLFFIVHGVKPEETNPTNFETKELDGFLGNNFVVTFHVQRFRSIKNVKQQIRSSTFACQRGAAFLLLRVLDELVDLYMPVVDDFDEAINALEDRVFETKRSDNAILAEVMDVRRSVARLKRISARQLDVLYRMSHGEFEQIPEPIIPFYRDVHDHLLRITDLAESYRDLVAGLFDIHFAVIGNRTNDVMKTLAVVSATILPLSLIAGIYGMNFEYMPELRSRFGYFAVLAIMAIVALLLLIFFWRRGWIFQSRTSVGPTKSKDPAG